MLRRLQLLLLLLAAVALWSVLSAVVNDRAVTDALPYVVATTACAAGLALGLYAVVVGAPAAGAVGLGLLAVLLLVGQSGAPVDGTLGATVAYPNAMAALAVQVGALCLLAGTSDPKSSTRWFLLASGSVAVTVWEASVAGLICGVLVLVAGVWALFGRAPAAQCATVGAGTMLMAAALVQVVFTAAGSWPLGAVEALSVRRAELWSDAWSIASASPWIGQGPGAFVELSPTAADPDTTAAHSVALQVAAELGLIGAVVVAAVVVAGLVLARSLPPRVGLVAGAAWTAAWLHGLVDYVLAFPLMVFAVGATMGVALWAGRSDDPEPALA